MTWRAVGESLAVPEGTVHVVAAGTARIALCRTGSGLYAVEDRCTHDGGPLGDGELFDDAIECPRHGARFDVRSGRVLRLPAVRPVKTYDVREHKGQIEVDLP